MKVLFLVQTSAQRCKAGTVEVTSGTLKNKKSMKALAELYAQYLSGKTFGPEYRRKFGYELLNES